MTKKMTMLPEKCYFCFFVVIWWILFDMFCHVGAIFQKYGKYRQLFEK